MSDDGSSPPPPANEAPAAPAPPAPASAPPWARSSSPTTTSSAAPAAPAPAPAAAPIPAPAAPRAAPAAMAAAPAVHHLAAAPAPVRASALPRQLRRLAYVVSLVLGGGAVIAGLWSIFLLPLLHATYSARNALALPQAERWGALLARLRGVRELAIFPARTEEETAALVRAHKAEKASQASQAGDEEETEEGEGQEEGEKDGERKLLTAPEDSPKSASISLAEESVAPGPPPTTSQLHADPSVLGPALRELASAMDATSTTRTSLLSTLEGYTSGLHRELFLTRGAGGGAPWSKGAGAVGLGTLSANLAKAGGNNDSPLGLPAAKSEEWDAVRREVRAIKGILLNRRNFAPPRTVSGH